MTQLGSGPYPLARALRRLPGALLRRARKTDYARKRRRLASARVVVNQLTGFMLSDFYLSDQISSDEWGYLNPRSRHLATTSTRSLKDGAVIYVNPWEIEVFAKEYLPRLTRSFVLITGKMWAPPQPHGAVVDTIASHPGLLSWFSQNTVDEEGPIQPFPLGVALRSISNVASAMKKHANAPKDQAISVPYSTVHPHLAPLAKSIREGLLPLMDPPQRHQDYLATLARTQFVISPPGDGPDTFRHWESIAMGAIPVSQLPAAFKKLFGDSIILVDDLAADAQGPFTSSRAEANRALATVDYWRRVIDDAKNA